MQLSGTTEVDGSIAALLKRDITLSSLQQAAALVGRAAGGD